MKIKLVSAALAAAIITASGAALAQSAAPTPPTPPQPRGVFLHGDINRDGIVTRDEVLARVDARFARADANKDGKITADERPGKRWRGRRGAEGAAAPQIKLPADVNGDGAVTLSEQRAQALKTFAYVDRNGDGKIDAVERQQFREASALLGDPGKRGPRGHRFGRHGRHGPPPAGAPEAPKAK